MSKADDFELYFGSLNLKDPDATLLDFMKRTKSILEERIKGKLQSSADIEYEKYMIEKIDRFLAEE